MSAEESEIPGYIQRKIDTYRDVSRGDGRAKYYHADHFGSPEDNRLAREEMYRLDVDEAYAHDRRKELYGLSVKSAARRIIENPELAHDFFQPTGELISMDVRPSSDEGSVRMFGGRACEMAILHLMGERGFITDTHLGDEPPGDLEGLAAMIAKQGKEFIDDAVPDLKEDGYQPIIDYMNVLAADQQLSAEAVLAGNYETGVYACVTLLQVAAAQARWRNPDASPEDVAILTRASVGILSQTGSKSAPRASAALSLLRGPYGGSIEIKNGTAEEKIGFVDRIENLTFSVGLTSVRISELFEGVEISGCPAKRLFPRLIDKVVQLGLESGLIERELDMQAEPPLKNVIEIPKVDKPRDTAAVLLT